MEQKETKNAGRKPLTSKELEFFCKKLAMLVHTGMMLHDGVKMMADDTEDEGKRGILTELAQRLEKNDPLEKALAGTGAFPEYMVHMVAVGSEAGRLEEVIQSLGLYYKNQSDMKESLKSAVIYPAVLVVMMLLVLIFLAVKVLPVFEGVFRSLGAGLTPQAAFIVKVGSILGRCSVVLLAIAAILLIAVIFFAKTEKGRSLWKHWISQRKFSEKFAVSSFSSSMALMLESGLSPKEAMAMTLELVANKRVAQKVKQCLSLVESGEASFLDAISKSNLFSNTALGLLSVGSASGSVDTAMGYVAECYEEEFWSSVTQKIAWIEPISVGLLSIFAGIVLISVMLPLLGVMSSIG